MQSGRGRSARCTMLDGAMILVLSIAFFRLLPLSSLAMRLGCDLRGLSFAAFLQMSLATFGPTRLNSSCRNADQPALG